MSTYSKPRKQVEVNCFTNHALYPRDRAVGILWIGSRCGGQSYFKSWNRKKKKSLPCAITTVSSHFTDSCCYGIMQDKQRYTWGCYLWRWRCLDPIDGYGRVSPKRR